MAVFFFFFWYTVSEPRARLQYEFLENIQFLAPITILGDKIGPVEEITWSTWLTKLGLIDRAGSLLLALVILTILSSWAQRVEHVTAMAAGNKKKKKSNTHLRAAFFLFVVTCSDASTIAASLPAIGDPSGLANGYVPFYFISHGDNTALFVVEFRRCWVRPKSVRTGMGLVDRRERQKYCVGLFATNGGGRDKAAWNEEGRSGVY